MSDFNLDQLLDGTLDDLADLPEFKSFPPGTHRVTVSMVDKTAKDKLVGGHPAYELRMKYLETIELAASDDVSPVVGSEDSVLYMLDNEFGQGALKKILTVAAAQFGAKPNRILLNEDMQNVECLVVTKSRQNKEKTKSYTDIVELQII